jgi:hypothetical protein
MTKPTEMPAIDMALVHEFEYRKKKIELKAEANEAIGRIRAALNAEDDIEAVKEAAIVFAQQGMNLVIENVDNAIVALESTRKATTAQNAMKFLLLLLLLSNVLTGLIVWLILR